MVNVYGDMADARGGRPGRGGDRSGRGGDRSGRGGSCGDMPASWRVRAPRGGDGRGRGGWRWTTGRRDGRLPGSGGKVGHSILSESRLSLIGLRRFDTLFNSATTRGVVGGSSLRWTFTSIAGVGTFVGTPIPTGCPGVNGPVPQPVSMSFSWSESKVQRVDVSRAGSRWRPHGVPMANGIHGVRGARVRATSDLRRRICDRWICARRVCARRVCARRVCAVGSAPSGLRRRICAVGSAPSESAPSESATSESATPESATPDLAKAAHSIEIGALLRAHGIAPEHLPRRSRQ